MLLPLLIAARVYIRQARPAFLAERAALGDLVELRGVTFGYGDGQDVLDEVDLAVRPGERLAVAEHTGG